MDKRLRGMQRDLEASPGDDNLRRQYRQGLFRYLSGNDPKITISQAREWMEGYDKSAVAKAEHQAARKFLKKNYPYEWTALLGIVRSTPGQRALVLHEPKRTPLVLHDRDIAGGHNVGHVSFSDRNNGEIDIVSFYNWHGSRKIIDKAFTFPYSLQELPYPDSVRAHDGFQESTERLYGNDDRPEEYCMIFTDNLRGVANSDLVHFEDDTPRVIADDQHFPYVEFEGDNYPSGPMTFGDVQIDKRGLFLPEDSRYLQGQNRVENEADLIKQYNSPYQVMAEIPLHAIDHFRRMFYTKNKPKSKNIQIALPESGEELIEMLKPSNG